MRERHDRLGKHELTRQAGGEHRMTQNSFLYKHNLKSHKNFMAPLNFFLFLLLFVKSQLVQLFDTLVESVEIN